MRVHPFKAVELVVVGSLSYDYLSNPIYGTREAAGGAGAYVSLAAASLGIPVGIVGILSESVPTEVVTKIKNTLDCSGLKKISGVDIVFGIDYDENWHSEYYIDSSKIENELSFKDFPYLYKFAKAVHLCPMSQIERQVEIALDVQRNMDVIISATAFKPRIETQRREVLSLLQIVDLFFLNLEEALLLTSRDKSELAYEDLEQLGQGKVICVTNGENGVTILANNTRYTLPAYITRLKDPTGAGEAFAGSFIAKYLKSREPFNSALTALCVSSLVIEEWGFESLLEKNSEDIEFRLLEYHKRLNQRYGQLNV